MKKKPHSFWHKIPLVRLLIPFALGIGISMFYSVSFPLALFGFGILLLLTFLVHLRIHQYVHRWFFGLCISLCMVAAGFALHAYQNELRSDNHFIYKLTAQSLVVLINEQPTEKSSSYKTIGKILSLIDSNGIYQYAEGHLLIYLKKDDISKTLQYGDVIIIPSQKVNTVPAPKNPDEFNYKRYLAFNNVYFQCYLVAYEFQITPNKGGNFLKQWAYQVQVFIKQVLIKYIGSANETAVAQALLYGNDDDIDSETVKAYSNTGTLHVLAVSGMHVGLIFAILSMLLKPLSKWKRGEWLKHLLILILLWLYSLICGLSPSILRATVMFSFVTIANMINSKSSVYNTLAASAFVLLCFNCNMLANVGFQLSYLAVLGIVFFQPLIGNWHHPSSWLGHQIWTITAVSLAAQLITFPIGLLYFHQFPNCFLVSNLIIIPLTTIIIYGGLLLVSIGWISFLHPISWLLGKCVFGLIWITNYIVVQVERLPYAYVQGIHVGIPETILLYGMLICMTGYLLFKYVWLFKGFLLQAIAFSILGAVEYWQQINRFELTVYAIKNHAAVRITKGRQSVFAADSVLLQNEQKMKFHLLQHFWSSGIKNEQLMILPSVEYHWKKLNIEGKTIVISGMDRLELPKQTDYLIIRNKLPGDIYFPKTIKQAIITGEVKPTHALTLINQLKAQQINAYYVIENGAFQLSLLP
jgi:competence protein ComEC